MGKLYRKEGHQAVKSIIVVATAEEYKLAKERYKGQKIIKTGVGGTNVYEVLQNVPRNRKIVNFGYAGSNTIPIGTEVEIGKCKTYHPNVQFQEPTYKIDPTKNTVCYTASDFVTKTTINYPVVFDMELAYICAMGFKNIRSIKIISDNLSLKQYEEII